MRRPTASTPSLPLCPSFALPSQEKWSATIWAHTDRYAERDDDGAVVPHNDPPLAACHDDNEMCAGACCRGAV